jgi:hypothetical protein
MVFFDIPYVLLSLNFLRWYTSFLWTYVLYPISFMQGLSIHVLYFVRLSFYCWTSIWDELSVWPRTRNSWNKKRWNEETINCCCT